MFRLSKETLRELFQRQARPLQFAFGNELRADLYKPSRCAVELIMNFDEFFCIYAAKNRCPYYI